MTDDTFHAGKYTSYALVPTKRHHEAMMDGWRDCPMVPIEAVRALATRYLNQSIAASPSYHVMARKSEPETTYPTNNH